MKPSMIYRQGHTRYQCVCAGRHSIPCNDGQTKARNVSIPEYWSADHAKNEGWKYTTDPLFCQPGKAGVWVCPECSAKYKLEDKTP